jgi:hypothetical protein
MRELAEATYDSRLCARVMCVLWTRLADSKKRNWRHGHRALLILWHLLQWGSDRSVCLAAAPHSYALVAALVNHDNSETEAEFKLRPLATKVCSALRCLPHLQSLRVYPVVARAEAFRHGATTTQAQPTKSSTPSSSGPPRRQSSSSSSPGLPQPATTTTPLPAAAPVADILGLGLGTAGGGSKPTAGWGEPVSPVVIPPSVQTTTDAAALFASLDTNTAQSQKSSNDALVDFFCS